MINKIFLTTLLFTSSFSALANENDIAVITDEKEKRLVFEQCSRMTPTFRTSYRELDEKTVAKIEKLLPQALAKVSSEKTIEKKDYYRQYVAFEVLRREMVYVNGIHKEAIKQWAADEPSRQQLLAQWQDKAINVCGGKQNYWGALYDDQAGQIVEVLFNTQGKK